MSRPELIKQLKQKNPELNQSDLETVIDTFCESIEKALKNNSYIELRDFGTFSEKNKVRFRASKKLKEFINNE